MAIEKLNIANPFVWDIKEPKKNDRNFIDLNKFQPFKRAVALSQLNLYNLADLEIRNIYGIKEKSNLRNLFFASEELNLPAVLIRLGSKFINDDTTLHIRGLYPVPLWQINKEYVLDKALLFALIRRESAFNIKARSHKGARGLMQIMPRTASKLHNDYRLRYANAHKLYSMQLNLKLGQKYLLKLIASQTTKSSILETLIAYNAGMSRLKKWKESINTRDPLVFIESIPIKETRWFVKYILTDLWIYRDRLGQEKPTREMVAKNIWPTYKNLDYTYIQDAKYRQ